MTRRVITTASAQYTAARHGLSSSAGAVLVVLADLTRPRYVVDGLAVVWPSVEFIAEQVGLTTRTVQYHLAALKRAGLLVDVPELDDDSRTRVRGLVIVRFIHSVPSNRSR